MLETKISEIMYSRRKGSIHGLMIVFGCLAVFAFQQEFKHLILLAVCALAILLPLIALAVINSINCPMPKSWYRLVNSVFYRFGSRTSAVSSLGSAGADIAKGPADISNITSAGFEIGSAWYMNEQAKSGDIVEEYYRQKQAMTSASALPNQINIAQQHTSAVASQPVAQQASNVPSSASQQNPNITITVIKEHWVGLSVVGLLLAPLSGAVIGMLFPLVSFSSAIIIGVVFQSATVYVMALVPFCATIGLLYLLLNHWSITDSLVISFASVSMVWGLSTLIYNLSGGDPGSRALVLVLAVALVAGFTLPLFVALREHKWKVHLSETFIVILGLIACTAGVVSASV